MASLTAPPPRPVLRQGYGDTSASSHPSIAIMEAARRKREAEEAEAKRKADIDAAQEARAEEALKLSQNADERAAAAAKLAQEQEKREAAAGVRAQEEAVAKRAPGDLALEVAAYDLIPESSGKPFAQQPRYTKQTLIDKYGAAAATGWDEAMRNYTGDKTLGKTPAPTPVAGQTVQQDEKGNVTVTTTGPRAEEHVSPKELAEMGQDPTGLDPAARTKKAAELRIAQRKAEPLLTPAEKAVDSKYATDFVEWETGGKADVKKSIDQLNAAKETLSKQNVSGPIIGITPDVILSMFNSEAIDVREAIEEVVQRNLRAVLGGQFAQREGEQLIRRAYNPKLSEEENAVRLERLMKQIEAAAVAKDSAAEYFRQNGTLKGWGGKIPSISDFDPTKDTDAKPKIVRQNGVTYTLQPDGSYK